MPGLSKVQKLLFVVILFMTLCEMSNSYLMWYILHEMPTPHYLSLLLISYIRTTMLYCYIHSQLTIKIIPVYIPVCIPVLHWNWLMKHLKSQIAILAIHSRDYGFPSSTCIWYFIGIIKWQKKSKSFAVQRLFQGNMNISSPPWSLDIRGIQSSNVINMKNLSAVDNIIYIEREIQLSSNYYWQSAVKIYPNRDNLVICAECN